VNRGAARLSAAICSQVNCRSRLSVLEETSTSRLRRYPSKQLDKPRIAKTSILSDRAASSHTSDAMQATIAEQAAQLVTQQPASPMQRAQAIVHENERRTTQVQQLEAQERLSLDTLPPELQVAILAHCSTADLAAVAGVCSQLRTVAHSDDLWQPVAVKAFEWKTELAGTVCEAGTRMSSLLRPIGPLVMGCMPAGSPRPEAKLRQWAKDMNGMHGMGILLARSGKRLRESFVLPSKPPDARQMHAPDVLIRHGKPHVACCRAAPDGAEAHRSRLY